MDICNLYKKEIENTFKFCIGFCGVSETSVGESIQNKENGSCCQSCWNVFATACVVFLIGVFFIPLLFIWSISICLKTCNGHQNETPPLLHTQDHENPPQRSGGNGEISSTSTTSAHIRQQTRTTKTSRTRSTKNMNNFTFYKNEMKSKPNGEYIEVIHRNWLRNYNELESNHNFIQWLFPIKEQGVNYYASPITDDEIRVMKADMEIVQRLLASFDMMLDFYGLKRVGMESTQIKHAHHCEERYHNINKNVHNNLRITRIIKCLCLFDLDEHAAEFVKVLAKDILIDKKLPRCKRSLEDFWLQSLPTEHEQRIISYIDGLRAEKRNKNKEDVCAVKSSSIDGHQEIASQEGVLIVIDNDAVKKEVSDKNEHVSFEGRVSATPTADKGYVREKNAISAATDTSFHSAGGNPDLLVDISDTEKNKVNDKKESLQARATSTSPTDKSNVKESNVTSTVTDTSFHRPVGSVFASTLADSSIVDSVNGNNVPAFNAGVERFGNVKPTFAASSADVESGSDVRPADSADGTTMKDKEENDEPMEVDDVEAQTAKF